MMSRSDDVLVIGSGASAAHAARTLLEGGAGVTMVDAGFEDSTYSRLIPDAPFETIRRSLDGQHRFFLGDEFEGIAVEKVDAGPQVTPPRRHVVESGLALLRTEARGFAALESLALGGLGGAWGAVSFPYTDVELLRSGLDPTSLRSHYEVVATRIGVSGVAGEFDSLVGPLATLQPAADLDDNASAVLARYKRREAAFRRRGFRVGRPYLALLTQPLGRRPPTEYNDMDFWSDAGGSVWRPSLEIANLQTHSRFRYQAPYLATHFSESGEGTVTVTARGLHDSQSRTFSGRALVLAAGALGTTRIVLRSLGCFDTPVPLVSNPHTYVPCLTLEGFGTRRGPERHSLAQLTLLYDPTGDGEHLVQAQMYSYGSLLLFRLLTEMPLARRESLRIARMLAPNVAIWTLQHEEEPRNGQTLALSRVAADEDRLTIESDPCPVLERRRFLRERRMAAAMRRLGLWPLRLLRQLPGSSVHYAGSLPYSEQDRPLTTEPEGRLRGTTSVWIADGAALRYLPAKGLTLTLMANADRIASNLLHRMRADVR